MTRANVAVTKRRTSTATRKRLMLPPSKRVPSLESGVNLFIDHLEGKY
jgi:hypothetical protein